MAAHVPWIRRITDSCTDGASTISTGTTGKCCGWIRRTSSDSMSLVPSLHKNRIRVEPQVGPWIFSRHVHRRLVVLRIGAPYADVETAVACRERGAERIRVAV